MKVILLAPTPPPAGGIAAWTVRMKNASLRNGWTVDVVDEKVIGNREVFGDRVKLNFTTELKRIINIWRNLHKKLKDKEVTVVHSNIPAGINSMAREIICLLITKLHGKKFIIHYRCTIPNLIKGKLSLVLFRILTNGSDAVISLNTPSKEYVINHSKTPVYVIPNFVENIAIEERHHINRKIRRVVYVGGVVPEKGCLEIVEASKYFPDIEFRLIGKISEKVKSSIETQNVILLDEQSREIVNKELRETDVFVFPSYFSGEGFSNSLVEAMAKGLPCVASEWAANVDMLEHRGGIIIPKQNSDALIEAIRKIQGYTARKAMSDWNIEKVKNCYTESVVTNQYVDLYEKIISKES